MSMSAMAMKAISDTVMWQSRPKSRSNIGVVVTHCMACKRRKQRAWGCGWRHMLPRWGGVWGLTSEKWTQYVGFPATALHAKMRYARAAHDVTTICSQRARHARQGGE